MNIETVLKETKGVSSMDAEVLLAAILKKDRTWILAHPEHTLTEDDQEKFTEWLERRVKKEPVAYITGVKEFYGRKFAVDPAVLVPRPSTEGLVDIVLSLSPFDRAQCDKNKKACHGEPGRTMASEIKKLDNGIIAATIILGDLSDVKTIVDIGTGSGCIAITLALEAPEFKIIATDISSGALAVAKSNALQHGVEIDFREGDLLEPIQNLDSPFLIVSNPPYIPEGDELMADVEKYEPHGALFSGKEGTDILKKLITQAKTHASCRGVVIECREEQAKFV